MSDAKQVRDRAGELLGLVHLDPERVLRALPARALRRDAPARPDRDEPAAQAADHHPRRADDRARHPDAAGDHRSAAAAARAAGLLDDLHLARPVARGRARRSRAHDVRRADRRARQRQRPLLPAAASVLDGPAARGAARQRRARQRRLDRRQPAGPDPPAARLHVQPALPLRDRRVQGPRAGAPRRSTRRTTTRACIRWKHVAELVGKEEAVVAEKLGAPHDRFRRHHRRGQAAHRARGRHARRSRRRAVRSRRSTASRSRSGRARPMCLVGESGCGKTTTGRCWRDCCARRAAGCSSRARTCGRTKGDELARFRRAVQLVHQDPYASLNPIRTVYQTLSAPLFRHKQGARPTRATVQRDASCCSASG